jgi:hypothetical protein
VTTTVVEMREMAERRTILGRVLVPHVVVHLRQRWAMAGDDDDEKSNDDVQDKRKEKKVSLVHCT